MKHLFVSASACLIILVHYNGGSTKETNLSSCSSRPPVDFRGPTGIPGERVSFAGQKGEMGEYSKAERANLEEIITDVQGNMTVVLAAIRRGYMELDDGWITPLNGFQYKHVNTTQSWNSSRVLCREMGGDLATHGIQVWETRRIIFDALVIGGSYWVGVEDKSYKGIWQWTNGHTASIRETALWDNGHPFAAPHFNCGFIGSSDLLLHNLPCSTGAEALCQKPI